MDSNTNTTNSMQHFIIILISVHWLTCELGLTLFIHNKSCQQTNQGL